MLKIKLLFVLIAVVVLTLRTTLADQPSRVFLPMVKAALCVRRGDIAWLDGRYPDRYDDLETLCADLFYHSNWALRLDDYLSRGGIPIVWWTPDVLMAKEVLPVDYDGYLLFANECELSVQCNESARDVATMLYDLEAAFPLAKLIGPNFSDNAVGLGYVDAFVNEYRSLYGKDPAPYRWAIHEYRLGAVDVFCNELNRLSLGCDGLWVTEYGQCTPKKMLPIMDEVWNDNRVERRFYFTNRSGWNIHYCSALLDGDELTSVGQAYIEFMTR